MGVAPMIAGGGRPRSVKMVDLSKQDNIIDEPTSVHCEKDVKCWRSLASMLGSLVIPCCCGCKLQFETKIRSSSTSSSSSATTTTSPPISSNSSSKDHDSSSKRSSSVVTGTIFGQRKGKVVMSIQEDPREPPVMLLELAMPTVLLVKEMSSGLLRIAMECEKRHESSNEPCSPRKKNHRHHQRDRHLYSEPVWTMYCNGRKVGFAVRRPFTEPDRAVLGLMQSVSMGAGVIPVQSSSGDPAGSDDQELDELMYMRATYERVVGSADSESFHMINPDGSPGQELSIFLLRA
ncbi:protein MIZU-KUSSEI 1 [Selaginella moellendorffii]|nr:protein MIZU-KUSSEI 1 [Selaginella moellendorffii]|eukprot:XP_002986790.2 protein MIZU-KUSSEI 1 [Selaginella moellendorffii]